MSKANGACGYVTVLLYKGLLACPRQQVDDVGSAGNDLEGLKSSKFEDFSKIVLFSTEKTLFRARFYSNSNRNWIFVDRTVLYWYIGYIGLLFFVDFFSVFYTNLDL